MAGLNQLGLLKPTGRVGSGEGGRGERRGEGGSPVRSEGQPKQQEAAGVAGLKSTLPTTV